MATGALQDPQARLDVPEGAGSERRIALVVHTWGHASAFFAWVFLKQYVLRRVEKDGCTSLDPNDKLYIVKAGKDEEGDRWKVGGPLVPDLDTALRHYPAEVVRLEGAVKPSIQAFVERNAIDILVVGEHWPSTGLQLTSVSEWVKANVSCPFLIIRRSAVAKRGMKISSQSGGATSPTAGSTSPPDLQLGRVSPTCPPLTAYMTGRRVAIAYTSFAVGRGLLQYARDKVLSPNDEIYIVHAFADKNPVMHQTMKLVRAMTLQRGDTLGEVTRDNSIDFGADLLAAFPKVHLNVVLQGDPRSAIASFCEAEDVELLIISTRSGGKIRKKLSGGSVSSHLIDHAPCPCLVVPSAHMGIDDVRDSVDEEALGTSPTSPPGWLAASLDSITGKGDGAARRRPSSPPAVGAAGPDAAGAVGAAPQAGLVAQLQRELERKDEELAAAQRTISALQQQVQQLGGGARPGGLG